MRYTVVTNPLSGRQHRLAGESKRRWFLHYGEQGGGFGYYTFRLARQTDRDWPDLGYGYPITLRKGPYRVLFDGQITKITESSSNEIEVWALGWGHVATDDTWNRVYCDNRFSLWLGEEDPNGLLRPDAVDWENQTRLYFKPRAEYILDQVYYARLRYTSLSGKGLVRFVAHYCQVYPSDIPGDPQPKVEIRDASGSVLWSLCGAGSGDLDLAFASTSFLEIRYYPATQGVGPGAKYSRSHDGEIYAEFTGVKVFTSPAVNIATIANDVLPILVAHGLADDATLIQDIGYPLEPAYFESDQTIADVLTWAARAGLSNGLPLAWGVAFDATRRLFVEPYNLTTVAYEASRRAPVSRSGDWKEAAQVAYGVYTNADGFVERTDDVSAPDVIEDQGGYYRRVPVQLQGTFSPTLATAFTALWLSEHARPGGDIGSFTVEHGLRTPTKAFVPFDEIRPGCIVRINWRAFEATASPDDYRNRTTYFFLSGVTVDEEARTAELIPRESTSAFERQMRLIAELLA